MRQNSVLPVRKQVRYKKSKKNSPISDDKKTCPTSSWKLSVLCKNGRCGNSPSTLYHNRETMSQSNRHRLQSVFANFDYMHTSSDTVVIFGVPGMILNIYLDALHQTGSWSRSCADRDFLLGIKHTDNKPIKLNSNIYALCTISKNVATS